MLDFIRLATTHHLPMISSGHHHCHAGWVQTHCPFCTGGRSGWHLGFSLERGNFHCWRCGGVRFWPTLEALLRISNRHQLRQIVDKFQIGAKAIPAAPITRKRSLSFPPGIFSTVALNRTG